MSFTLDLKKAVKNIKEHTEETVQGTLFQVFSNVVKRTPVGNPDLWKDPAPPGYIGGTLRNSWHCSVGAPSKEGKINPSASGADSIQSINQALSKYNLGQTVYLANNLPYAYPVEFGWSKQAPEGMVRVSLAEAQSVLDASV
jgi:hypothetical protein